ncbi:DUF3267 domain-containing protein [Tamlana agarivorans]|uniref:DUF3267 domain-containing protein n=1 Tax=Pseudotamlana agarivorans TaxID=481183 RepID=A0ACC5U7W9_9FLAO|nr:DUF3267 domain-containing protein [Tamlana agarivorans]MBU2950433.1 DUF3267 domain-containing protein [Tamlana agarivorans]
MQKKTIFIEKANWFALLFMLLTSAPVVLVYYLVWGSLKLALEPKDFSIIFIFLFVAFVSIVIHELIHGAIFAYFSEDKWKSVKFGVLWAKLTPYAHCRTPLFVNQYMLAVVMPGVILGILPVIIGLSIGSLPFLYYGLLMIMAAAGDFLIFVLLLKMPKGKKILDHDSEMAFYVLDEETS